MLLKHQIERWSILIIHTPSFGTPWLRSGDALMVSGNIIKGEIQWPLIWINRAHLTWSVDEECFGADQTSADHPLPHRE